MRNPNKVKTEINNKKIFTGEGYLLKKPPRAYKKFWEKRYFRLRNGVLYWYKNEEATEAQNKIILLEASDCFTYKDTSKFKILINGSYYKFSASTPKEAETWVQAINKAINKVEETNEEYEEKNHSIFIIDQKNKQPLFVDYDQQKRIEKNMNLISKRDEKKFKQLDIVNKIKAQDNVSLPPMIIQTNKNANIIINSDDNNPAQKKE